MAEGSPDGINSHVSVTKAKLPFGGYRLLFDLQRDGLHQDYLPKTHSAHMNRSPAFDPDMCKETSQVLSCEATLPSYSAIGLMMMMVSPYHYSNNRLE